MAAGITEIKQRQRMMWATGDYPDIAQTIEGVGTEMVERIGVGPGDEVLDVGTGNGNVALAATGAGAARVVGLDLTPELLEKAGARAAQAGVSIEWIEGDAEELPFADSSFDKVTSCFGAMFAPQQQRAADELMRVCRPGGTIAVTAWTPEGLNGQTLAVTASTMPPPPPGFQPPILWGMEDHVRELFGNHGAEIECTRGTVPIDHESAEGWVSYLENVLGPLVLTKAALEAEGRWPELRAKLVELYERFDSGRPGAYHADAEYLLTLVRKPD